MNNSGTLGWATALSKRRALVWQQSWQIDLKSSVELGKGRGGLLAFVTSHHNVRVLLEVLGKEVANGVILLLDQEIGAVRHACALV